MSKRSRTLQRPLLSCYAKDSGRASGADRSCAEHCAHSPRTESLLLSVTIREQILRADHLAVQCARNQSIAVDFAGLGIGDSDVVDLQRAAESAFVIGFGFFQVGQGADLGSLSVDEIPLSKNDVIKDGGTELIFLLFRVKGLLLELPRFAGGFD